MSGSTVSGYHILGSDCSQMKVSKNHLIRLIDKNLIDNCRIQTCNNELLIRGNGINLNELPVFDERRGELRNIPITGDLSQYGKDTNPNNVFGKLRITRRIVKVEQEPNGEKRGTCIGYEVISSNGVCKKLRYEKVIEMASTNQIGNAQVLVEGDTIRLTGIGVYLEALPAIYVDAKGNEVINPSENINTNTGVLDYSKAVVKGYNKPINQKEIPLIDVTLNDVLKLGSRKMNLRKDLSKPNRETKRLTGIQDIKDGKARLYVQAMIRGSEVSIEEFISLVVKFGEACGVIMRITNRNTGDTFDIREETIELEKINEKVLIAVMCCGLKSKHDIEDFGLMSIQMKDASSERAYQFE